MLSTQPGCAFAALARSRAFSCAAFIANSIIFFLIGVREANQHFWTEISLVVIAILLVTLGRAVAIYPLSAMFNRSKLKITMNHQHILFWGGLRGAIALALVLSLPAGFNGDRELIKLMAFGVVLFTLLAQSTTMRSLLRRLGLSTRPPEQVEYEKRHARLTATRAALHHLERRHAWHG